MGYKVKCVVVYGSPKGLTLNKIYQARSGGGLDWLVIDDFGNEVRRPKARFEVIEMC